MNLEETAALLNDLLETCRDGEYGFDAAARFADSIELKTVFSHCAADCRLAAMDLESLVRQRGGTPEAGGSVLGALHRGWFAVRGRVTGADDRTVLDACERGENSAVARYRNALSRPDWPAAIRPTLERQFDGAKRRHDHVRELRERWAGQQRQA